MSAYGLPQDPSCPSPPWTSLPAAQLSLSCLSYPCSAFSGPEGVRKLPETRTQWLKDGSSSPLGCPPAHRVVRAVPHPYSEGSCSWIFQVVTVFQDPGPSGFQQVTPRLTQQGLEAGRAQSPSPLGLPGSECHHSGRPMKGEGASLCGSHRPAFHLGDAA